MINFRHKVIFLFIFFLFLTTGVPSHLVNSSDIPSKECSFIFETAYGGKEGSKKVLALIIKNLNPDMRMVSALAHSEIIIDVSEYYQVDPLMILSIIKEESAFQNSAKSYAGAIGLMQLMPGTAKYISDKELKSWKGVDLLIHPRYNITLGTAYYKELLLNYKSDHLALTAYNMGPTNLSRKLNRGGFSGTSDYSRKVTTTYENLLFTWRFFSDLINCSFGINGVPRNLT